MSGKSKFQISRSLDERIKRIISGTNEYDSEFSQVSSAYILGFNYGNVTNCVGLTKNYQLHHAVFPVVGLVFFKISPTDEDIKASLKTIQEYSSSPNGLGSFKVDKNEHLFLIYSVDKETKDVEKRIFNFSKGSFVRRKRLRLNVLNDPYCPRHIHGGSEDLFNIGDGDSLASTDDDQIDHLIFFIHGVGGVCDVRFRSCVEVVADFKKLVNNLLAQQSIPTSGESTPSSKHLAQHLGKGFFRKYSTDSTTSHTSDATSDSPKSSPIFKQRRVECLPVSWHSLTRRQTGINDQLNLCALSSVPKLRYFLNKVVMDALLYASGPVYTQTIVNNVGNEINRLYSLFMEKHPNFTGSVSLAGHSLGSVIVFDLLAHQNPFEVTSQDDSVNNKNLNEGVSSTISDNKTNPASANGLVNHHVSAKRPGPYLNYKTLNELLSDMDLLQYAELFHREHIDLNSLLLLTDVDMKELNLPLGARRKLGTYINLKKIAMVPVQSSIDISNSIQQATSSSTKSSDNIKQGNNILETMNTGQYLIEYPQLKFKPRCFFAFGSPIPMFLNVRGIQNISRDYKLPTCDRMFNIFHPYDPIAYRVEPLIDPRFKNVEPVLLAHHRGGKRIHVQIREGFAKVGHDIKHRLLGSLRNTWSSFTRFRGVEPDDPSRSPVDESSLESRRRLTRSASSSVDVEIESFESAINMLPMKSRRPLKRQPLVRSQSETNGTDLASIMEASMKNNSDIESDIESDSTAEKNALGSQFGSTGFSDSEVITKKNKLNETKDKDTCSEKTEKDINKRVNKSLEFDSNKVGLLNGGRRIDYVLQEKPIELFNEYIFAFTSHANYWQNEDSALILLNEIYQVEGIQMFDHLLE